MDEKIYYYVWSVPQTGKAWYTIITRIPLPPPKGNDHRKLTIGWWRGTSWGYGAMHPIMLSTTVEAFCPGTVHRLGSCQFVHGVGFVERVTFSSCTMYSRTSSPYSRLRANSGRWTCYCTEYKHLQEYAFTKAMSWSMHPIYRVLCRHYFLHAHWMLLSTYTQQQTKSIRMSYHSRPITFL